MKDNHDAAFGAGMILGLLVATLLWVGLIAAGVYDLHPYRGCNEDEVWAWQQDYRPVYGESPWECVAIDDLIGER